MGNTYSQTWFDVFLSQKDVKQTRKEVQFILNHIDLTIHRRILDVACALGRHVKMLEPYGFDIVAIDINEDIISRIKTLDTAIDFKIHDMREIDLLDGIFDVVLIMWQSFGYYDQETNRSVISQIFDKLNTRGVFIVDIYLKEFFYNHQGSREVEIGGRRITETKFVRNNRLTVHLDYHDKFDPDEFNWYVYDPEEFITMCREVGFDLKSINQNLQQVEHVDVSLPRVQYVFSKKEK